MVNLKQTSMAQNASLDNAPHILVVDDDSRIRNLLSRYLKENGFRVSTAGDAAEARRKLIGLSFDLLIVDVMMPAETGTDFTHDIRKNLDVPVIMLTALGEAQARITGLEAGADDYLAKPFEPRELVLRIQNILKRVTPENTLTEDVVFFGPFQFSTTSKELKKGTQIIKLTEREREIMLLFTRNIGQEVSRTELAGLDANPHNSSDNTNSASERTVDVQINRLRRKIENDLTNPRWLQTVRGVGYKLHIE